jgi:hypothetical protein
MKIWIVSESDWDEYHQYGLFSTEAKAQAYIDMVQAAEKLVGRTLYLDLDEYDVDDLIDRFPVFAIELRRTDARRQEKSVLYLNQIPDTETRGEPVYSVKIFGHDLAELRARVPEARREYFGR